MLMCRILAYDPNTSFLLITGHPSTSSRYPTLIINTSVPLLGQSPSAKDISQVEGAGVYSYSRLTSGLASATATPVTTGRVRGSFFVNREKVRMGKGEWVCVVGWLEGEVPGRMVGVSRFLVLRAGRSSKQFKNSTNIGRSRRRIPPAYTRRARCHTYLTISPSAPRRSLSRITTMIRPE